MITIVGTAHVLNLAEQVSFIVKNSWPDAVLVELDQERLDAVTSPEGPPSGEPSGTGVYESAARYQARMSEEHGATLGNEFAAAVAAAKLSGAAVIPIDRDARGALEEMWDEMSATERFRYRCSAVSDAIGGRRKVAAVQKSFADAEDDYIEGMRRKYPAMVHKLIDERNELMASRIREESEKYADIVVVVGDAHVEGLCRLLDGAEIRKVRLADLTDRERMDRVRDMIWKGESE